ncbi:MAG: amidohydrolase family protein [Anaerolineae bacterium]|nr:amidohydrolase family protein [Anaerolineae bacterium]
MQVIDFHTHIFAPEVIAQRERYCQRDSWFQLLYGKPKARMATVEKLIASMDEAGVAGSVVFGFAFADMGLCREGNAYVLEAAARYPGRLFPFAAVNPACPKEALREARACLEKGAQGIGELMPDGQGFTLTSFEMLDPLMELARAYEVPVMIHVNEQVGHYYAGKGKFGPREAYLLALHYPENTLVFPHWGGGLPFYELMPEVQAALQRVYYDTAATHYLYRDAIFEQVASWTKRILWGTDYPLISQKRSLRRVRALRLAPEVLERVLGGNALAILARGGGS